MEADFMYTNFLWPLPPPPPGYSSPLTNTPNGFILKGQPSQGTTAQPVHTPGIEQTRFHAYTADSSLGCSLVGCSGLSAPDAHS